MSEAAPIDPMDDAPCGFLLLNPDSTVAQANRTLANWLDTTPAGLAGQPLHSLLSFGGRIAYETHLSPMLHLQGFVEEIALDLLDAGGGRVPVFANARQVRDENGGRGAIRIALFRSVERRRFERALVSQRDEAAADAKAGHETALLREQFIAVLGHDLRNPLAAIDAGIRMLAKHETLTERGQYVIEEMRNSAGRAATLIDDVLDLARGRLGAGLTLANLTETNLGRVLDHVVGEIRAIYPTRVIRSTIALDRPVRTDPARIAQLASNLIANAVTHGAADQPILVDASIIDDAFIFAVTNGGEPIAVEAQAQLFEPFFRGAARRSQQGLGLGLFIVNEIAKAHGGTMRVTSDDTATRFAFTMPLR